MNHKKTITIVLLVAMLASIPVIHANATPGTSTSGTGTIASISIETDAVTKITTTVVGLTDEGGLAQNVRISLESAITLGLVIPDEAMVGKSIQIKDAVDPAKDVTGIVKSLVLVTDTLTKVTSLVVTLTDALNLDHVVNLDMAKALELNLIIPNKDKIGTPIVIDPKDILDSSTYTKTISKLGSYFGPTLGVTFEQLAAYRKAGYGYGVITQALWMAVQLKGDAALLDQILTAKKTGDFSAVILPDGKTVANWGQLRKLTLTDPHQNLGRIMSGKATPLPTLVPTASATPAFNGNSHGSGHGNGNGHGQGNNK
jgi:hypothetical protein